MPFCILINQGTQNSKLDSPNFYQKPATLVTWWCTLFLIQFAKQFTNLLYKRNRVNSPEAWIINEAFRYEESMRKTATTNICIAFFLKNISDNDKCHINTQKANYFNTS